MHKIVDGKRVDMTPQEEDAFEATRNAANPPRCIGTPREFLNLFTQAEWAAFHAARQQSAELDLWLSKAVSGEFSLDHPDVAPGVASLVFAGIIDQARADEILATDFDAVGLA